MIHCPNCKHKIRSRAYYCPLCGTSFEDAGVSKVEIFQTERLFARRTRLSFLAYSIFDTIYLSLLLIISITTILAEGFLTNWNIRYSYIPISILTYIYILFRLAVNNPKFFPQKILIQAICLSVIGYFITRAFSVEAIFFMYIAPTIFLVSLITVSAYTYSNYKLPEKHVVSLIFMALLTIVPYILTLVLKIGNHIYPLIVACLAAASILVAFAVFAKRIWHEIKALFNI